MTTDTHDALPAARTGDVFKIVSRADWAAAREAGCYGGAPVDLADGFIHLSSADQLAETAARHFAGAEDHLIVAFDAASLGGLRWEPSRGGALFPHLYGALDPTLALWEAALAWDGATPVLPARLRDEGTARS